MPIIFGENNNNQQASILKKETTLNNNYNYSNNNNSNNLLYKHSFSGVNGQMMNPSVMLRGIKLLNNKSNTNTNSNNVGSDGEDLSDEQLSARSDEQQQQQPDMLLNSNKRNSITMSPRLLNMRINNNSNPHCNHLPRRSIDFTTTILPLSKSKRNSIDLDAMTTMSSSTNRIKELNLDSRRNSIGTFEIIFTFFINRQKGA